MNRYMLMVAFMQVHILCGMNFSSSVEIDEFEFEMVPEPDEVDTFMELEISSASELEVALVFLGSDSTVMRQAKVLGRKIMAFKKQRAQKTICNDLHTGWNALEEEYSLLMHTPDPGNGEFSLVKLLSQELYACRP